MPHADVTYIELTGADALKFIRRVARRVFVPVHGTDDTFYARVAKATALYLLQSAEGQLVVNVDGSTAYVERRTR